MRTFLRALGLTAALLLCAACEPEPPTAIPCNRDLDCPSGQACSDGLCRPAASDAGVDASAPDVGVPPDAAVAADAGGGVDGGAALQGEVPAAVTDRPESGLAEVRTEAALDARRGVAEELADFLSFCLGHVQQRQRVGDPSCGLRGRIGQSHLVPFQLERVLQLT